MNKCIFIFWFLFSFTLSAQYHEEDEITTETSGVEEVLNDSKITQDSINSTLVPLNTEQFSKKEFNPNFRNEYSEYYYKYDIKKENGFLSRMRDWWQSFLDWLSFGTSEPNPVFDEIVNIVLIILGGIALGYLIYYLNKKGFIRLFSKKNEIVVNEKYIEENIEKIDFEALTKTAIQDNNVRKAIRYYYLWMLKNWSQNNFIDYEPNKTTKKYLSEITDLKNKTLFQYISYIYDNVWYGSHEISSANFTKIEQQFIELINKKS